MKFPSTSKKGDFFWFGSSPVRISKWCYYNDHTEDYYFDIEFLEFNNFNSSATLSHIPLNYDFVDVIIREMTELERLLY